MSLAKIIVKRWYHNSYNNYNVLSYNVPIYNVPIFNVDSRTIFHIKYYLHAKYVFYLCTYNIVITC